MSGFLDVLAMEPRDGELFTAPASSHAQRSNLFGGRVAAQALRAASLTVDDPAGQLSPHSLHCYFVRSGRLGEPLDLRVTRVRDGRSFVTRRVGAYQGDDEILSAMVSFQQPEPGAEFSTPPALPLEDPSTFPPVPPAWDGGAELCFVQGQPVDGPLPEVMRYWARVPGPGVGGDRMAEACGITFLSDLRAGGAAAIAGGYRPVAPADSAEGPPGPGGEKSGPPGMIASLDHAIWLHRSADPTDWLLFSVRPVANTSGRGLVLGTVHTRAGRHVASFAQELVVRPPRAP